MIIWLSNIWLLEFFNFFAWRVSYIFTKRKIKNFKFFKVGVNQMCVTFWFNIVDSIHNQNICKQNEQNTWRSNTWITNGIHTWKVCTWQSKKSGVGQAILQTRKKSKDYWLEWMQEKLLTVWIINTHTVFFLLHTLKFLWCWKLQGIWTFSSGIYLLPMVGRFE